MQFSPLEQKVENIVRPVVEDMGFTLYCVKMTSVDGPKGGQILQVMAEDPATGRLGIDECTKLSKAVSVVLDVEDPISGNYRLELSSPGIDRFLIQPEHFEKYKGFEIKAETNMPTETGQKRFRGFIQGVEGDDITLKTDKDEVTLPHHTIAKAKLVMSDELIKATDTLHSNQNNDTNTQHKEMK